MEPSILELADGLFWDSDKYMYTQESKEAVIFFGRGTKHTRAIIFLACKIRGLQNLGKWDWGSQIYDHGMYVMFGKSSLILG